MTPQTANQFSAGDRLMPVIGNRSVDVEDRDGVLWAIPVIANDGMEAMPLQDWLDCLLCGAMRAGRTTTTPQQFADKMLAIEKAFSHSERELHIHMDELMSDVLKELGYGDGIQIYKKQDLYYDMYSDCGNCE
jgi:hypothetical protein